MRQATDALAVGTAGAIEVDRAAPGLVDNRIETPERLVDRRSVLEPHPAGGDRVSEPQAEPVRPPGSPHAQQAGSGQLRRRGSRRGVGSCGAGAAGGEWAGDGAGPAARGRWPSGRPCDGRSLTDQHECAEQAEVGAGGAARMTSSSSADRPRQGLRQ